MTLHSSLPLSGGAAESRPVETSAEALVASFAEADLFRLIARRRKAWPPASSVPASQAAPLVFNGFGAVTIWPFFQASQTSCDVRVDCLEYALANGEKFGIWGGLSERERRRLKKRAI